MAELTGLLGLDMDDPTLLLAREMTKGDRRLVDKLIEIRQRNITQKEMAALMGVSQSAIAKFENGRRDPRLSTIRRYALALGVIVRHTIPGEDCTEVDEVTHRESPRGVREIETYLRTRSDEDNDWQPVQVPEDLPLETSRGQGRVRR